MSHQNEDNKYDIEFYEKQRRGSLIAAQKIVPLILKIRRARSVIDFGCGVGGWLSVFKEHGVECVLGVDGDYVDRTLLMVEPDEFVAVDLRKNINLGRFDIAISLEVAEHLEEKYADEFVSSLTGAASFIIFSAAIPGQGGVDHVNEKWPTYWIDKFSRHGYSCYDLIRGEIWNDANIPFWYRQNIIVLSSDPIVNYKDLKNDIFDIVHPEAWNNKLGIEVRIKKEFVRFPNRIKEGLEFIGIGLKYIIGRLAGRR